MLLLRERRLVARRQDGAALRKVLNEGRGGRALSRRVTWRPADDGLRHLHSARTSTRQSHPLQERLRLSQLRLQALHASRLRDCGKGGGLDNVDIHTHGFHQQQALPTRSYRPFRAATPLRATTLRLRGHSAAVKSVMP